jgi:hypothetical protein
MRNIGIAAFELLVNVDGKLRNLSRTGELRAAAPVTISAQGIYIGQNPGSDHEVRLFAGLALQVQPYRNSFVFKTNEEILGVSDDLLIRSRLRPSGNGLNKRWCNGGRKLAPRQKKTKSSFFDPRAGFVQGKCSKAVLAHSFGARL